MLNYVGFFSILKHQSFFSQSNLFDVFEKRERKNNMIRRVKSRCVLGSNDQDDSAHWLEMEDFLSCLTLTPPSIRSCIPSFCSALPLERLKKGVGGGVEGLEEEKRGMEQRIKGKQQHKVKCVCESLYHASPGNVTIIDGLIAVPTPLRSTHIGQH